MSHNTFTGEKKNSPNTYNLSVRDVKRSSEQQNNNSKNCTNNNRYRNTNNYDNRRPYSVYSNPAPNKPEFNLKKENFPTLGGSNITSSKPTSNMEYSKTLSTFEKGSRVKTHPTPEKKFVSLINLSKKKKNKEEDYETDEELQQEAIINYNSADEELEEFYEHQDKKYTDNQY